MNKRCARHTAFFLVLVFSRLLIYGQDDNPPAEWARKISAGYEQTAGNTRREKLSGRLFLNRKAWNDEVTVEGTGQYSSSGRLMDAQRWYGMARYAFSFGRRKWYNFYKVEADHDRFAGIDYRLIPSAGVGYWLSDRPDWKAMGEVAVGHERTFFRNGVERRDEAILIPRVYAERRFASRAAISQEIVVYPSLEHSDTYRLRAVTALTCPVAGPISLEVRFVDDYNSAASPGIKKNDILLSSSLVCEF